MSNKLIVVTAPSGAGKSSICERVIEHFPDITFSVSATTRPPRAHEQDGVHYRFLGREGFRHAVENGKFLEYEEVYPGVFYGTLREDVEHALENEHVLLDIDVKGAKRVKEIYGNRALALFIKPPSLGELRRRLTARQTENEDTLHTRLQRAKEELDFESFFDMTIVNDVLDKAVNETISRIQAFINIRS